MRISLLEKLILLLTILAVVAVSGVVAFLMLNVGLRRVVSIDTELAIQDTIEWLDEERARVTGKRKQDSIYVRPEAVKPGEQVARTADGKVKLKPASEVKYFEKRADDAPPPPQDEIVFPEEPWIKRQPGVVFVKPKRIAPVVYKKYQNFENAWGEAQSGWGEMTTTDNGEPAYEVKGFDPNSRLAKLIKLQPGDKVISINGLPIGNDVSSGKALYDQLSNETRFAVLIERNKQRTVLSYTVR